MRLQLRGQSDWHEIEPFLTKEEFEDTRSKDHKLNHLQLLMGRQIYEAMANGTLGGFDSFQMEGQLLALANDQGGAERIKNTPLPRQYDFFTRIFVLLFALLLPFGLLGFFSIGKHAAPRMARRAFFGADGGGGVVMERTWAANEDPFENKVTDVALTPICNTIERNLREMLGEKDLPPKMEAVDGYLF